MWMRAGQVDYFWRGEIVGEADERSGIRSMGSAEQFSAEIGSGFACCIQLPNAPGSRAESSTRTAREKPGCFRNRSRRGSRFMTYGRFGIQSRASPRKSVFEGMNLRWRINELGRRVVQDVLHSAKSAEAGDCEGW